MKKLVLFSKFEEDKGFSIELAAQLECEWASVSSIDDLRSLDPETEVILGIDSGIDSDKAWQAIAASGHTGRTHLIVEPTGGSDQVQSFRLPANFVIRRFGETWKAARSYSRALNAMKIPGVGLSKFGFMSNDIHSIRLTDSMQRGLLSSAANEFLVEAGCPDRFAAHMITSLDEVLMNAVLDAPLGRSAPFKEMKEKRFLPPESGKTVEFQAAHNADGFGFSVVDHYGSLRQETALKHLSKGLNVTEAVGKGGNGAGLGLSIILKSGASMVFSISPGIKTEVCFFYKKTPSVREIRSQFQFFAFQTS